MVSIRNETIQEIDLSEQTIFLDRHESAFVVGGCQVFNHTDRLIQIVFNNFLTEIIVSADDLESRSLTFPPTIRTIEVLNPIGNQIQFNYC